MTHAAIVEKFSEAVRRLVGEGSVNDRLAHAFAKDCLADLTPRDVRVELREEVDAMLRKTLSTKGRYAAGVQTLPPDKAAEVARDLADITTRLWHLERVPT